MAVWEGREHKLARGAGAALGWRRPSCGCCARPREAFDALLVGYPGHLDLPRRAPGRRAAARRLQPARLAADTLVADRGRFRAGSLAARALAPSTGARFARPTWSSPTPPAHADLLAGRLPARDASRSASSAPRSASSGRVGRRPSAFTALFVGKLIPLHGLETILARGTARARPARSASSAAGQLEHLLDDRPRERRARALGRVRAAAGRAAPRRAARSASSAPRRRRRA